MSDTPKRPRAQAIKVAEKVVAALDPCCTWIELAGSLRRQTNMVGDIEIVAVLLVCGLAIRYLSSTRPADHASQFHDQNRVRRLQSPHGHKEKRRWLDARLV